MFKMLFFFVCAWFISQGIIFHSYAYAVNDVGLIGTISFGEKKLKKKRKEQQQVFTEQKTKRFLLITGCSRSGTTFIADALSECGLDIGHEVVGEHGCSSWFMCLDNGDAPWKGRPTARLFEFEHTFHQVRHPLDVISSVFATEHKIAVEFFSSHIPEIHPGDSHLVKCAKFWYYWNLYAEKKAEWRYQIEKIGEVWEEMGQRLGITLDRDAVQRVSSQTNHRSRSVQFSWDNLSSKLPADLFANIQEMAVRYGYSIDDG